MSRPRTEYFYPTTSKRQWPFSSKRLPTRGYISSPIRLTRATGARSGGLSEDLRRCSGKAVGPLGRTTSSRLGRLYRIFKAQSPKAAASSVARRPLKPQPLQSGPSKPSPRWAIRASAPRYPDLRTLAGPTSFCSSRWTADPNRRSNPTVCANFVLTVCICRVSRPFWPSLNQ
jgi:hypothetical protein